METVKIACVQYPEDLLVVSTNVAPYEDAVELRVIEVGGKYVTAAEAGVVLDAAGMHALIRVLQERLGEIERRLEVQDNLSLEFDY